MRVCTKKVAIVTLVMHILILFLEFDESILYNFCLFVVGNVSWGTSKNRWKSIFARE